MKVAIFNLAIFLTLAGVGAASAQPTAPVPPTAAPSETPATPAPPTDMGPTPLPPPGATITHRALRGIIFHRSHAAQDADQAAMQKMMDGMNAPYTGDSDHDFVVHMIPHHQGAIDMCQTELQYGVDAEIKRLCNHIISGQQADIKMMQAWLATHPAKSVYNIPQRMQWK